MSEVMHNTQREFWRPPAPQQSTADAACERCGTEFMVGSRFCHVCGTARQGEAAVSARNWTRYLEFHNIQEGLGLSTASLIAFFLGAVCVLFTVATDWIYSERTVLEWQAVQAFRIQALLGAIAAFVAGILLKKTPEAKD
ncbi:MAG: hypothetical protein DMG88_06935 [Acidobacteria bacterium]|nr:MAG: hypothetical protein DMG88_06935 [Acidobacteriota bacterium]